MVKADNWVKYEIDSQIVRYSGFRQTPVAAATAVDEMMIVLVVVYESLRIVQVWGRKREYSSCDGIYL
jgi:hypothetical protein